MGESLKQFLLLPDLVAAARAELASGDEALKEEAPDEFKDELMSEYMDDPVILPSGHRVDRSTIKQHLLNDPTDPFNRAPMTIDDVKPDVELKERMEKWLAEKRAARKGAE
jgi:ubiquitin conjugation factor E4 B